MYLNIMPSLFVDPAPDGAPPDGELRLNKGDGNAARLTRVDEIYISLNGVQINQIGGRGPHLLSIFDNAGMRPSPAGETKNGAEENLPRRLDHSMGRS
jgi:hypothetical protein